MVVIFYKLLWKSYTDTNALGILINFYTIFKNRFTENSQNNKTIKTVDDEHVNTPSMINFHGELWITKPDQREN